MIEVVHGVPPGVVVPAVPILPIKVISLYAGAVKAPAPGARGQDRWGRPTIRAFGPCSMSTSLHGIRNRERAAPTSSAAKHANTQGPPSSRQGTRGAEPLATDGSSYLVDIMLLDAATPAARDADPASVLAELTDRTQARPGARWLPPASPQPWSNADRSSPLWMGTARHFCLLRRKVCASASDLVAAVCQTRFEQRPDTVRGPAGRHR